MKKKIILVLVSLAVLLLVGCPIFGPPTDEEIEAIDAAAREKTSEGLNLALDAALTGDRTQLDAFIEAEDVDGTLEEAFDDYFTATQATSRDAVSDLVTLAMSKGMLVWYNGTDHAPVQPGDVLLFAADGSTWQNMLTSLILVGPYFGHAGIVDPNRLGVDDACVLSATIELDDGYLSGVTYQSLEELKATNFLIVRLPYDLLDGTPGTWMTPPAAAYPVFAAKYDDASTDYSFVTVDMRLDAITKVDQYYFYCSKVPWFMYRYYYYNPEGIDIEQDDAVDYYETYSGDADARWKLQRESLLYKLYKFFLWVEGAQWWRINSMADQHVKEVLREIVTPDELLGFFAYWAGITIP